jgi:glycosyltransferase involved in cell wall biosynthesis
MSAASPPLVSVVTPVYNGERYLRECIESVLAQTYANWHYVIVDNCSTDGTLAIAREYAARDPRIRVHQNRTFVKAIANYNNAVRQISPASAYTKVVAADDWLFPECLERMVAFAESHPSVGIVAAYQLCGRGVAWDGVPYPTSVVKGIDACRAELLGGPHVFGTPTTLLYRSALVASRDSFYNEANIHADTEACVEFLEQCDFGFVHQILTFNRKEDGSLTSFSDRIYTYLPGFLHLLQKYGPRYLTREELEQRLREHRREYYRALGRAVLQHRDREFWQYHRQKLSELGEPLNRFRVALATAMCVADMALNPKESLAKIRDSRRTSGASSGRRQPSLERHTRHV